MQWKCSSFDIILLEINSSQLKILIALINIFLHYYFLISNYTKNSELMFLQITILGKLSQKIYFENCLIFTQFFFKLFLFTKQYVSLLQH